MNILELFCGTKSISKPYEKEDNFIITVDWDSQHKPDLNCNVLTLDKDFLLSLFPDNHIDYIHASPDCSTYSMAAISHHRINTTIPISEKAKKADKVLKHTVKLIRDINPQYFTMENPYGVFHLMDCTADLIEDNKMDVVTYCQYGDTRQKRTIFINNLWGMHFKPPCKRGDKCHIAAPRGSNTGTQGINCKVKRAVIPDELCIDLYNFISARV